MSQFQDLAYRLIASAGAMDPQSGIRMLFADNNKLLLKQWNGTSFADQVELVSSTIRPNSTAALILPPSPPDSPSQFTILCTSASSVIRALKYSEDDEDWVDDSSFPTNIKVHPDGKLVASLLPDTNGKITATSSPVIVYQDPSNHLIFLDQSHKSTTIPVNAVPGTPLSILVGVDQLKVFYISATDKSTHSVVLKNKKWQDELINKSAFAKTPKRLLPGTESDQEDGAWEGYVLTQDNKVMQLVGAEEIRELGRVDEKTGKFTPGTSAECCRRVCLPHHGYYGGYYQVTITYGGWYGGCW